MMEEFQKLKVIEDGKEVIRPDILQFLMSAAQVAQLVKLRKLEESKIPTGVKPLKLTVTDTIMEVGLYPPWISLSLANNGGGGVTVWVNTPDEPFEEGMVASGDTYSLDCTYPVIRTLYLRAEPGTTASVRVYGKEGKLNIQSTFGR